MTREKLSTAVHNPCVPMTTTGARPYARVGSCPTPVSGRARHPCRVEYEKQGMTNEKPSVEYQPNRHPCARDLCNEQLCTVDDEHTADRRASPTEG